MTRQEYEDAVETIREHSGGTFLQVRFAFLRHFDGDAVTAVVLAYILNLLHLKTSNPTDSKKLRHDDMWFRCPVGKAQQQLGMTKYRVTRAVDVLIEQKVLKKSNRRGNITWVQLDCKKVNKLANTGIAGNQQTRIAGNQHSSPPETSNPIYTNKPCKKPSKPLGTRGASPTGRASFSNQTNNHVASAPAPLTAHSKEKSQPYILAKHLHDALIKADKLMRPVHNLAAWSADFSALIQEVMAKGISKEDAVARVRAVLDDHVTHLKTQYQPRLYSASSFRKRFIDAEDRMHSREVTGEDPAPVELDEDAQKVLKQLADLQWPKGAGADLPAAVQRSLNAYKAFKAKVTALVGGTGLAARFAKWMIGDQLGHPRDFVVQWFQDHFNRVAFWDDWSGKLDEFTPQNKRFTKQGKGWAVSYANDTNLWDELIRSLNGEKK